MGVGSWELGPRDFPLHVLPRMWWRALVTVLLAAIVVLLVWDRGKVMQMLPQPGSPHEAYARALDAAGLGDTALARDWTAAAEQALREPESAALPLANTVRHDPSAPRAYGYRLDLRRGRVLHVALTVTSHTEPAKVFIDLFRPADGARDGGRGAAATGPDAEGDEPSARYDRVASAGEDALTLEHEIKEDGVYLLRIQPELLRGGVLEIGQRTRAALTFPVAGRDVAAVRSFFGDPRDGGRRDHHGLDIFAPRDTPVLAASDGYVTRVGTTPLGGHVVWVWDPERRQSHYYAHLSRQAVGAGERLRAGDVVGYVGNTGNARTTPPHLHFGIYAFREGPIDPLPFVDGARGPQPPAGDAGSARENPGQESTGSGG